MLRDRVRPRGTYDESLSVANDLKRWIFQCCGVADELVHRGVKIALLFLVFPREEILLPDVGKAFAAPGFCGSLLESEPFAGRVCRNRVLVLEQLAEVEEVGMGSRPLGERNGFPFLMNSAGVMIQR